MLRIFSVVIIVWIPCRKANFNCDRLAQERQSDYYRLNGTPSTLGTIWTVFTTYAICFAGWLDVGGRRSWRLSIREDFVSIHDVVDSIFSRDHRAIFCRGNS